MFQHLNITKAGSRVFFILAIICFLCTSCYSSKNSYGGRKYKKRCGECPSWSYQDMNVEETATIYGEV